MFEAGAMPFLTVCGLSSAGRRQVVFAGVGLKM